MEEVDETRFNRFVNLGITAEDMKGMIENDFDLDPRDLTPYTYPDLRTVPQEIALPLGLLGILHPLGRKAAVQTDHG